MRVYATLNGKYIGCDPTPVPISVPANETEEQAIKRVNASFPVYADRDTPGAWEEIELTLHANGQFDALLVAANRQISFIGNGTLESRAAGTLGPFELPFAADQPDSLSFLYRVGEIVLTLEAKS